MLSNRRWRLFNSDIVSNTVTTSYSSSLSISVIPHTQMNQYPLSRINFVPTHGSATICTSSSTNCLVAHQHCQAIGYDIFKYQHFHLQCIHVQHIHIIKRCSDDILHDAHTMPLYTHNKSTSSVKSAKSLKKIAIIF
jgi:hypothetical protein